MGVNVDSDKVKGAASKLGCLILKTPFTYLGSKVRGSMSRVHAGNEVIDRVKNRLFKWKMKTLSIGGRLTLLKSVLGSIPIFHMSIYRAPLSVLRTLESIRSKFFKGHDINSNKASWVNWKKVLVSKEKGGLRVSSLFALNRGLMFKWIWRFYTQNTLLWVRVVKAIHGDDGNVGGHVKSGAKSCWLDIVRETHALKTKGINLLDCMHVKLGNGDKTVFWEDIWIDGKTLKNRFPRIYSLESCKLITVGAKLAQPSLEYSFRRNPRGGVEQDQFNELSALVHDVSLIPMSDRWKWDLESSGDFSVASVRKIIDDKSLSDVDSKTRGIDIDSIMCAICDNGVETSRHLFFYCCIVRQIVRKITRWWDVPYVEVHLNRLPTRVNLQHRGVLVSDPSCPIYHSEDEDLAHLFFRCSLVTDIVRLVCRWWNIAWASIDSYSNWLHWFNAIRLSPKVKDLLEGVFYITWWSIWRFRNQVLFSSLVPRKDVLFDDIARKIYSDWDLQVVSETTPETSPSRITSSPSLSPQHTPVSAPSTSPPPITETTPTAEEPALMPHESPLQSVQSLGRDEGSVSLNELMDLVTQLTNKVGSLENELTNTKNVYGSAITKLVKRVKKLEKQVKTGKARRRTKIVLLEDEAVEEDSSKQGRSLIEELDMDADISLVPPHAEIQEKASDETKVLLEEEEATEIVQDQGSCEKGEQEVSTADTTLNTVSVPFSTASATPEVSTAAESLVYIRRSAKKKDKGKAIVIEDESIDEEERKRIARDAKIAKQLQEEYDKAGKKEAVTEVDIAYVIDWNDPSVIRYHALQNRPRSVAEVRKNMMVYLKNQGGYKMKDFKGMSYDDIRPIFEKVWDQIHSFVPMDSEEEVQRLKRAGQDVEAKPAKRQRTEEVSESVQEQTDEEPKTDELSQEQLN
ncbi:RNA-directed DNA polymerase, eukaryota, reverse transcriptase zinc-binding domain protein [Tanacetum coccineum]